jgi:hypothetical protein
MLITACIIHSHSVGYVALQRDDENFSIAYDFCVQKAWFNTFPDVNPRETEELYARWAHQSLLPRILAAACTQQQQQTTCMPRGRHCCFKNVFSKA